MIVIKDGDLGFQVIITPIELHNLQEEADIAGVSITEYIKGCIEIGRIKS